MTRLISEAHFRDAIQLKLTQGEANEEFFKSDDFHLNLGVSYVIRSSRQSIEVRDFYSFL